MEALLKDASQVYAVVYFGAIIVVALLESAFPRKAPGELLRLRWFGNFSMTILGAVLVRLLFPLFGVGWAVYCSEQGLGLLNRVQWPWWAALALTVVVIDLSAYLQHYLLHRVPVLWRLHRTHHSDEDYDFTTGVRFHPFENIYSTAFLMGAILLLGAPPAAVFISQLVTVAVVFGEHANVQIPTAVDRVLRLVLVTPDMHRIHHSEDMREGNSNFASLFSFWDRLFHTYVDQPAAGHDRMAFGVPELAGRKHQTLPWMLAQPFLNVGHQAPRAESADSDAPSATPAHPH